jgi:hypothetical protein
VDETSPACRDAGLDLKLRISRNHGDQLVAGLDDGTARSQTNHGAERRLTDKMAS